MSTALSAEETADALRSPTPSDPSWLRLILAGGPLLALLGGVVGLVLSPVVSAGYVVAGVVLPALIVTLLVGSRGRRSLFAVAALLNAEAVLAGALLPAGIAVAIVMPMISVALVQEQLSPRAHLRASVAAGVVTTLGVTLAVLVGPASVLFTGTATSVTILSFTALVTFALALDWRVTHRLRSARDAAEAALQARLRAELELEQTSHLLSAVVEASPMAVQAFTLDRTVTVWNAASERIFGWTAAELLGHPMPIAMIPESERVSAAERIQRTIEGEDIRGDRVRRLTKDGRELWIDIYGSALRDREGRPFGLAGQLGDVTERVALEARLAHAQRLEAIGRLAGGVAHDFNNTLTAIGGFATLIADEATDPDAVRADATTIGEVVDRSRQLTRQLLAFARRAPLEPALLDLRLFVTDLEPVLCRLLDRGQLVQTGVADVPLMARVDPGQLEQTLVNLVVNARDAMPAGGRVSISVRPTVVAEGDLADDPAVAGPFVALAVSDTGTGIAPDVLDSVFEPFFTTKPPGHGTGLGLAMVRDFVRRSGGHVILVSVPGEGTTVELRFPEDPGRLVEVAPPR